MDNQKHDVLVSREDAAKAAAKAIMEFRHKVRGRYYPGYHEDMRDFVRSKLRALPPKTESL